MLRRVVSVLLIIIMVGGLVLSSPQKAVADGLSGANRRINSFIKMAQNDSITDDDISGLTQEEIRFLGVFMSNFFVPYMTELGHASYRDGSITDQNKKDLIKVLSTRLAFSEEMATDLVELVFGLSRSSAANVLQNSSLGWYYKGKDGKMKRWDTATVGYIDYQIMMFGGFESYINSLGDLETVNILTNLGLHWGELFFRLGIGGYYEDTVNFTDLLGDVPEDDLDVNADGGFARLSLDNIATISCLNMIDKVAAERGYSGDLENKVQWVLDNCSDYLSDGLKEFAKAVNRQLFRNEDGSKVSRFDRKGDTLIMREYYGRSKKYFNESSSLAEGFYNIGYYIATEGLLNIIINKDVYCNDEDGVLIYGSEKGSLENIITAWNSLLNLIVPDYENKLWMVQAGDQGSMKKISELNGSDLWNILLNAPRVTGGEVSFGEGDKKRTGCEFYPEVGAFMGTSGYIDRTSIVKETILRPEVNMFYGYYEDDNFKIISDCYATQERIYTEDISVVRPKYTDSQLAFLFSMMSQSTSEGGYFRMGYGSSIFDFNENELNISTDGKETEASKIMKDMLNDYTLGDLTKAGYSIFGQRVTCDCFGNIIIIGSQHQIVAVPGCMNPYTWVHVKSDGKDEGVGLVGSNSMMFKLVESSVKPIGEEVVGPALSYYDELGNVCINYKNIRDFFDNGFRDQDGNIILDYSKIKGIYTGVNYGSLLSGIDSSSEFRSDVSRLLRLSTLRLRVYRGGLTQKLEDTSAMFRFSDGGSDIKEVIRKLMDFSKSAKLNNLATIERPESNTKIIWIDFGGGNDYAEITLPTVSYGNSNGTAIGYRDNIVYVDNIGSYSNDTGNVWSALNLQSFIKGASGSKVRNELSVNQLFSTSALDAYKNGGVVLSEAMSDTLASSLYLTYLIASFYPDKVDERADGVGQLGYRLNKENLCSIPDKALKLSGLSSNMVDTELENIKHWTYYLLHPTEGFQYVRVLVSNKLNNILLGWHYDITGTNAVGTSVGATTYKSNMGYVTTPDLTEMEWSNSAIEFYYSSIGILVLLVIVLMVLSIIAGILRPQHAVIAIVIFSIFLIVPVPLINGVVRASNRVSHQIYGDKFTYWALVQEESYGSSIDEAANGSKEGNTYENYLYTLMEKNRETYSNQGSNSILLKWQAPKKFAAVAIDAQSAGLLRGVSGLQVGKWVENMLNRSYGGESFADTEDAVYMYRNYIDLSNYSHYLYNTVSKNTSKYLYDIGSTRTTSSPVHRANWDEEWSKLVARDTMDASYRYGGYTNTTESMVYVWALMTSNYVNKALSLNPEEAVLELTLGENSEATRYLGVNPDLFQMGIPQLIDPSRITLKNFYATIGDYEGSQTGIPTNTRSKKLKSDVGASDLSQKEMVGLSCYGVYSESPFYYFSWKMYSDGMDSSSHLVHNGYKNMILNNSSGDYFSKDGYLKDFLDMRSLFTYVIPYLNMGNEVVRAYDSVYGLKIHDGISLDPGQETVYSGDPESAQKYWHNQNVVRLYGIYSPWVDLMYDCGYAKPEKIQYLGKTVEISNPLDPMCYPSDRPMIFSEAEMVDYGLRENQLTTVEKKIQEVAKGCQERMFELLNYYNFSDVTLNTAAAINNTFVFNTVFSEVKFVGESKELFPQSFDLTDFSYDAFLRMILSNSTGESMLTKEATSADSISGKGTGDFYQRLVSKSSIVTAILLIILDIMSQYVLPALKVFLLFATFVGSILVVFAHLVKVKESGKFWGDLLKQVVVPLLKFFLVTTAFSVVLSLFVGVGNNAVTQTNKANITLGDPAMTIVVLLALEAVVVWMYFKLAGSVVQGIKTNSKASYGFAVSAVGGLAAGATMAAGGRGAVSKGSSSSGGGYNYAPTGRVAVSAERRSNGNAESIREANETEKSRKTSEGRRTQRVVVRSSHLSGYIYRRRLINKASRKGMRKIKKMDRNQKKSG